MSPIIQGAGAIPRQMAGVPGAGTSEQQTLTFDGVPTSGKFRLKFAGFVTAEIAYDADGAAVQAALRALPSIGADGCTVADTGGTSPFTVTFAGVLEKLNVSAISMHSTTMKTAGLAAVNVVCATSVPGVDASFRGAPFGAEAINTATGIVYVNKGTKTAPVWEKIGSQ